MPLSSINENTIEGIRAIAHYLSKSYSTVHKWIKFYGFPAMISPTGEWFTTKAAINAWIIATSRNNAVRYNINPFSLPVSHERVFQRTSRTIHSRINAEKEVALKMLYEGPSSVSYKTSLRTNNTRNPLYTGV